MTSKRTPFTVFPPILAAPLYLFSAPHPLNLRLIPHPLSLPHWGRCAGANAYLSWWRAAQGCCYWRDDGREGMRRVFIILNLVDRPAAAVRALVTVHRCRARLSARPPWRPD